MRGFDKHNGTETNNSEFLIQPAESHEDKRFTDGTIDFSEKLEVIGSREVEINTIKNKIDKNQKKLQDHRKKFEEMRNLQAKSMSKCLEGIEESEQAKKGFLKDIDVLSNEIENSFDSIVLELIKPPLYFEYKQANIY